MERLPHLYAQAVSERKGKDLKYFLTVKSFVRPTDIAFCNQVW